MEAWQTILKTALLGTGREAGALPEMAGAIGETAARACASGEPAERLLKAAAVLGTAKLAGLVPGAVARVEAAAPAETMPACSSGAASCLARMLAGEYVEVLPECLGLLAQAGKRVPHALLPELLERAMANRELRPLVAQVMGERGLWLMGQNTEWQFESGEEPAEAWETGTREVRLTAFRRLRESDPAGALAKLSATWAQEPPEDRAAFVESMATGLSMADEPLLEGALDDKRKEVRKAAAELLMRLPQSALVGRMAERLRACVHVKVTEKRKMLGLGSAQQIVSVEVTLPEACDKAMVRDGIDAKQPAGPRIGEKAWWLQQIVGSAPPDMLAPGVPAKAIVEACAKIDWMEPLYAGWARAAARSGDATWAAAMLPWQLSSPVAVQDEKLTEALAGALPIRERESAAIGALETHGFKTDRPALHGLLLACRPAWSEQLSRAVVESLRGSPRSDMSWVYYFREMITQIGIRMSPAVLPELAKVAELETDGAWGKAMGSLVELMQFRAQMQKANKES